jgi:hypothetical protein
MEANYTNLVSSFKRLVEDIIQLGATESQLIIVGDIFENKTYLTTDDIYYYAGKSRHKW